MGLTLPGRQRLHFSWLRNKVRVQPASIAGAPLGYAIEEHEANEIDQFVQSNQLGQRVSYNMWKLNSAAAVTMFKLKWS